LTLLKEKETEKLLGDNDQLRIRQKTLEDEVRYLREYTKKIISSPTANIFRERSKSLRGG
jgi:hypothetical protein